MSQQFLIPGMQDSQKAKACPQMPRIRGNGSACETARKKMLYMTVGFCRVSGMSSCGSVKTRWE
ncbi:MAG TPA: hypothetical protein VKB84_24035 [Candidatus Binataceae bacterium]|nr:hypothetical protein [Candidatus Binataceae bacterium]